MLVPLILERDRVDQHGLLCRRKLVNDLVDHAVSVLAAPVVDLFDRAARKIAAAHVRLQDIFQRLPIGRVHLKRAAVVVPYRIGHVHPALAVRVVLRLYRRPGLDPLVERAGAHAERGFHLFFGLACRAVFGHRHGQQDRRRRDHGIFFCAGRFLKDLDRKIPYLFVGIPKFLPAPEPGCFILTVSLYCIAVHSGFSCIFCIACFCVLRSGLRILLGAALRAVRCCAVRKSDGIAVVPDRSAVFFLQRARLPCCRVVSAGPKTAVQYAGKSHGQGQTGRRRDRPQHGPHAFFLFPRGSFLRCLDLFAFRKDIPDKFISCLHTDTLFSSKISRSARLPR